MKTSFKLLAVLTTLGLFTALASYSYARFNMPSAHSSRKAKPVVLASLQSPKCGEDWLCLVSWAEQKHKGKKN